MLCICQRVDGVRGCEAVHSVPSSVEAADLRIFLALTLPYDSVEYRVSIYKPDC